MITLDTLSFDTFSLPAICACALFWSSLVMQEKFSFGMDGEYLLSMQALVLAGLPTTKTLTLFFANLSIACPCALKIFTLAFRRSFLSFPTWHSTNHKSSIDILECHIRVISSY